MGKQKKVNKAIVKQLRKTNKANSSATSVFKVAGAKSLKLKARAKAVNTNLKKMNMEKKITEVNKQLSELQETLIVKQNVPKAVNKQNKKNKPQKTAPKDTKGVAVGLSSLKIVCECTYIHPERVIACMRL